MLETGISRRGWEGLVSSGRVDSSVQNSPSPHPFLSSLEGMPYPEVGMGTSGTIRSLV